jgi:PAS domain S-box-containing protein
MIAIDPGIASIAGVVIVAIIAPTWLAWWNTRQTAQQFKPNGGASMRDALNRLEVGMTATQQTSLTLATVLGIAHFEADQAGLYTHVSREWQKMAGLYAEDAMGHGWVNGIAVKYREEVLREWGDLIKNGRPFRLNFEMASGTRVFCTASAIKSQDGKVIKIVGFCEAETQAES